MPKAMHKEQTITVSAMEAAELKKPTTRRRLREREDRKEDILQAALNVFSERGYEATRIDDVAERAEIAKGTIYLYFKSKEGLFEGVITRWLTPTLEQVERLSISEDLTSEEALRASMALFYTRIAEGELRQILRLIIGEGPRFPHLIKAYYENVITRGRAAFGAAVRRGVETGEFRDMGLDEFPQLIMGPAAMGAMWKMLFDEIDPIDLDVLLDKQFDLLLDGVRAKGPSGKKPTKKNAAAAKKRIPARRTKKAVRKK